MGRLRIPRNPSPLDLIRQSPQALRRTCYPLSQGRPENPTRPNVTKHLQDLAPQTQVQERDHPGSMILGLIRCLNARLIPSPADLMCLSLLTILLIDSANLGAMSVVMVRSLETHAPEIRASLEKLVTHGISETREISTLLVQSVLASFLTDDHRSTVESHLDLMEDVAASMSENGPETLRAVEATIMAV